MSLRTRIVAMMLALCLLESPLGGQAAAPSTSNAALRYWMAFAIMQDPPADKALTDLLETVASGKAPWDEGRLGPILDANREATQAMQRGTKLSECDWGVEYELGPTAPIAHLAKARVLARLNTLVGMRLAARGQLPQAVDTWLAGVRFSQDVAQGGSLISLLTARAMLNSNMRALSRELVSNASLGVGERARINRVVRALPDTAFDWSQALRREEASAEVFFQQVSQARDPKAYHQAMVGQPAPENFSLPTTSDVTAFRRLMTRAADMLRQPPARVGQQLKDLEASENTLHPFFQRIIPSPSRMNDERAELLADRQSLLQAVTASPSRR